MSLQVQSARITYQGEDRLDITRKSGKEGLFLAPSWTILAPVLAARKQADAIMEAMRREAQSRGGYADVHDMPTFDPFAYQRDAENIMDLAWRVYRPAYRDEMRASYRHCRTQWEALLSRERVVLVCYCLDAEHCHRAILRRDILPTLGAVDCGELDGGGR